MLHDTKLQSSDVERALMNGKLLMTLWMTIGQHNMYVSNTYILSPHTFRLDRLRKIVPHAERANTATFLEEVINYIGKLKAEIATLKGEPIEPLEPLSAAHPTHTLTDAHTTATNDPTITVLSAPAAVVPETVGTSASPPAAGEGK